jgi:hypothetical protein
MSEIIFGYVLDPQSASIRRFEIDQSPILPTLYSIIGCEAVDAVEVDAKHDLWIDDSGWLAPCRAAIAPIPNSHKRFFAGPGVVLAHDEEGECASPLFSAAHFAGLFEAIQPVISADFTGVVTATIDGVTHVHMPAEYRVHLQRKSFTAIN